MDYYVIIVLIAILVDAGLAFLPASIAQRKGRNFFKWWFYGFLIWIVAIFHAISLPEIQANRKAELSKVGLSSNKKIYDIKCPVHLVGFEILNENNENSYINIHFQNLDKGYIKAIKLSIVGYNSFNEIVTISGNNTFSLLIQDLNVEKHKKFSNKKAIKLPSEEIRNVDITVTQVCFEDGTIIENEPNLIEIELDLISDIIEKQIAEKYSINANYYPKQEDTYWACTCGYPNIEDNCSNCGMQKDYVFSTFNKSNLLELAIIKMKNDELLKIEVQKKAMKTTKSRRKFLLIFASVAIFSLALYLLNIKYLQPNKIYNQAIEKLDDKNYDIAKQNFEILGSFKDSNVMVKECDYKKSLNYMNNGNYDEAIEILKSLENFNDSDILINECNYQKALVYISNSQYIQAIEILEDLNTYKDTASLLQKFTEEKTGLITEQIEIEVGKNLNAELIYSAARSEKQTVTATIEGYFIKGTLQGDMKCTFSVKTYHGTVGGWSTDKFIYIGEFKENTITGKGIIYTKSKEKVYEGEFDNGFYSGNGKLYWDSINGNKLLLTGTWKNGNIEGTYVRYYSDNTKNDEGTCFNGIINSDKYGKYTN